MAQRTTSGRTAYAGRSNTRYGREPQRQYDARRAPRRASYGAYREDYIYGSAAPQIEPAYVPSGDNGRRRLNEHHRARNTARRNRERAAHMNLGYVAVITLLMAAMCFILIGYIRLQADLTSSVKDISALEGELSTLKAANDERYNKIMAGVNLDEIKETAVLKLGMSYAEEDQIVRFTNTENDYVLQLTEIGE